MPPLQLINQEDGSGKFSIANSSFRVCYGGVVGAVPFVWESQPDTPRNTLLFTDNSSNLPLLTPPPSSFRSTASTSNAKQPTKNGRRSSFLHWILRKIGMTRRSPPVVVSSSSSFTRILSRQSDGLPRVEEPVLEPGDVTRLDQPSRR